MKHHLFFFYISSILFATPIQAFSSHRCTSLVTRSSFSATSKTDINSQNNQSDPQISSPLRVVKNLAPEVVKSPARLFVICSSVVAVNLLELAKTNLQRRLMLTMFTLLFSFIGSRSFVKSIDGNDSKRSGNSSSDEDSSIWKDENRIEKALTKSKRSKIWVDGTMNTIEETDKRVADLKAKEFAAAEAERKRKAKEWVSSVMLSQQQAIDEAERKQKIQDEHDRKARLWAESMIRTNEAYEKENKN